MGNTNVQHNCSISFASMPDKASARDSSIVDIEVNELMTLLKDEIGWSLFYEFCMNEYR